MALPVAPQRAGLRVRGRAEHLDRPAFGLTGSRGMARRCLDPEIGAAFVAA